MPIVQKLFSTLLLAAVGCWPPARHDLLAGGYAFGAIQTTRGCPKMAVAHTANPEPDGATRGFRERKGGRFRYEPGRILHRRACRAARWRRLTLWRAVRAIRLARELRHYPQLDPVIRRVHQILFCPQIPLGRLD